jgi:hypothetical protein
MRLQAGAPDGGGRRGESGLPEDRPPQRTARPRAREHQLVRLPAAHMIGQLVDEEGRDRHLASPVARRRAQHPA